MKVLPAIVMMKVHNHTRLCCPSMSPSMPGMNFGLQLRQVTWPTGLCMSTLCSPQLPAPGESWLFVVPGGSCLSCRVILTAIGVCAGAGGGPGHARQGGAVPRPGLRPGRRGAAARGRHDATPRATRRAACPRCPWRSCWTTWTALHLDEDDVHGEGATRRRRGNAAADRVGSMHVRSEHGNTGRLTSLQYVG